MSPNARESSAAAEPRAPTTSAGLIKLLSLRTLSSGKGCALPVPARVGRCAACAARASGFQAGSGAALAFATYAGTGMAPATSAPPPVIRIAALPPRPIGTRCAASGIVFAAEDAVVDATDFGARLKVLRRVAATLAVLSYPSPSAYPSPKGAATSPNDFPRRPPCCAICAASAGSFEMRAAAAPSAPPVTRPADCPTASPVGPIQKPCMSPRTRAS